MNLKNIKTVNAHPTSQKPIWGFTHPKFPCLHLGGTCMLSWNALISLVVETLVRYWIVHTVLFVNFFQKNGSTQLKASLNPMAYEGFTDRLFKFVIKFSNMVLCPLIHFCNKNCLVTKHYQLGTFRVLKYQCYG